MFCVHYGSFSWETPKVYQKVLFLSWLHKYDETGDLYEAVTCLQQCVLSGARDSCIIVWWRVFANAECFMK